MSGNPGIPRLTRVDRTDFNSDPGYYKNAFRFYFKFSTDGIKTTIMNTNATSTYPGSLELYCQEIFRTPLLSKAEEHELAVRQLTGDAQARERLIKGNLRLVVSTAKKFCGMGLSIEDLIAEGNHGLITAVERYNPHVGASLCTYASWWIRQRIFRAIENHGRTIRLPGHVLTRVRKMRAAAVELAQLLGREPDDVELAEHMGITGERVSGTRTAYQPMQALDELTADGLPLHEKLTAESSEGEDPYEAACHGCDSERVQQLLSKLPERLRIIIKARFGIGRNSVTLADLGKELGVTRERIRQLESRAMGMLRQALYRVDPASYPDLLCLVPPVGTGRSRRPRALACAAA